MTMKKLIFAVAAAATLAAPALAQANDHGSFDVITQYTFMDQTLPDGKHPVWVYYGTRAKGHESAHVVRVDMPSLDMCIVTPNSWKDLELGRQHRLEAVPRSQWGFAKQVWRAAFAKYMTVGSPRAC
jgi:hypothetical protein